MKWHTNKCSCMPNSTVLEKCVYIKKTLKLDVNILAQ
jgi:hypothetical protein